MLFYLAISDSFMTRAGFTPWSVPLFVQLIEGCRVKLGGSLHGQDVASCYLPVLCVVHCGIRNAGREPSWCRPNSEYKKAIAPLFIPS